MFYKVFIGLGAIIAVQLALIFMLLFLHVLLGMTTGVELLREPSR